MLQIFLVNLQRQTLDHYLRIVQRGVTPMERPLSWKFLHLLTFRIICGLAFLGNPQSFVVWLRLFCPVHFHPKFIPGLAQIDIPEVFPEQVGVLWQKNAVFEDVNLVSRNRTWVRKKRGSGCASEEVWDVIHCPNVFL